MTVMSYAVFGTYAFYLYSSGLAIALLRSELHFSYFVVSLSSGFWAGAAIVAGLAYPRITRRVRRRQVLWWSVAAMAAGSVLLATSWSVAWALGSIGILSFAGTTTMMTLQAALADHHGAQRDRALVEANVGAALCAVAAPAMFGALHGSPLGWRACMILPVSILIATYARYRHERLPDAPRPAATAGFSGRLPPIYWVYALLVASGMATEMCMIFFAAELIAETTRLAISQAAALVVSFYLGMLAGRIAGTVVSRRPGHSAKLIWSSLALAFAGVFLFWLSGQVVVAALGLFVAGIGVANVYPLSMGLALAAAPGQSDAANARVQLLGGSLAIAAPLLLGVQADQVGVRTAFLITPTLIAVSAALLLLGRSVARRTAIEGVPK